MQQAVTAPGSGYIVFLVNLESFWTAHYSKERFELTIDRGILGFNFRESLRHDNNTMTIPLARRLDFSEIPVIDIAAPAVVEAIQRACTEIGFFYVANHGVASEIINDLVAQSRAFFSRPQTSKQALLLDKRMRGYLPPYYRSYPGEERAGTSHQQGFWIGHDTVVDSARPLDGPNRWPQDLPRLRDAMLAYLESIETLSHRLLRLFALALELPEETLLANFNRPSSRLKLNHYPPQHTPVSDNNIGVVPHSDSGCFTILWQDDNGGLEVQNREGDWVGAPPLADSFVVNIGNILQYWSNGRFSSTPHRVINRNGCDRYSIPFFVNPDFDTVIRPLMDNGNASFAPFAYGKYQVDLWRQTFPIASIP